MGRAKPSGGTGRMDSWCGVCLAFSCRLHDPRPTFCGRLAEAGAPESTLALVGHTSRTMQSATLQPADFGWWAL